MKQGNTSKAATLFFVIDIHLSRLQYMNPVLPVHDFCTANTKALYFEYKNYVLYSPRTSVTTYLFFRVKQA